MALNENFATVWEAIADTLGDAPALSHGPLTRTWAELDDRAARFAGAMADAGVGAGSDDGGAKVGMALYNGPAYTEATFGAFKARAVPFNVNYRYRESELAYLLSNADCEVVVAHPELVDLIEAIRADVPSLRLLVAVGDEIDGSPAGEAARRLGALRGTVGGERPRARASSGPATTCGSSTPAEPPACPRV